MAEQETTTVTLSNKITVNGISYGPGPSVKVPKAQADDIKRMDYEHDQYLKGLNKKHKYIVDSGTIAVGGGAE